MKKAQGMPINVIIIAVLALIVLVIMGVLFAKRTSIFAGALDSCSAKQGHCQPSCGEGSSKIIANCPEKGDDSKNTVCCITIT